MIKITGLFAGGMSRSFKKHPVEVSLGLVFFLLYMIASEERGRLYQVLEIFPHAMALSFVLNGLFPQGRARIAYYVSFLLPSVFFFVSPMEMFGSEGYICSVFIAALAVLSSGWPRNNERFAIVAMNRVSAFVSACVVSLTVYLAAISIYASLVYIFGLQDLGYSFYGDAASFCGFVLVPWAFFSFLRSDGENAGVFSGILRIVVGYVLSPALVVYTAIMYVYFIKIALTWELPKGNVAYMVSAFMVAGAAGGMFGSAMENKYFGWFYKWFGLISLPLLAMFWVGLLYRVGQYGMTESRVYLLALGFLATLYAVRFIFPAGSYGRISLVSIAVLSALTFVPGISARDIGLDSQTERLESMAAQLGLTDENGRLVKAHSDADTLHKDDYRELFGAYAYVAGKKGRDYMKESYGFESAYGMADTIIPEAVRQYALYGLNDYYDTVSVYSSDIVVEQDSGIPLCISGYGELNKLSWYSVEGSIPEMEKGWTYGFGNDSLTVRRPGGEHLVKIDMNSYVRSRMPVNADGSKVRYSGELSRESKNALIYCDTAGVRIVFDRIEISVDSTGAYDVDNVVPLYVLTE